MEINSINKPIYLLESMCANSVGFNAAVDAFGRSITDIENNGVDDAPQV